MESVIRMIGDVTNRPATARDIGMRVKYDGKSGVIEWVQSDGWGLVRFTDRGSVQGPIWLHGCGELSVSWNTDWGNRIAR